MMSIRKFASRSATPRFPIPRYFIANTGVNLIVLDVSANKYFWVKSMPAGGLSSYRNLPDVGVPPSLYLRSGIKRELEESRLGPFSIIHILQALYYMIHAQYLSWKGFNYSLSSLNDTILFNSKSVGTATISQLMASMDWARLLYPVSMRCLQVSIALLLLLRRHGHPASVVIGANGLPFLGHAWVQVGDDVINDSLFSVKLFHPLIEIPYGK